MTLTFDLTHNLDLGCFKVKFRNSCISGIAGVIDVKWKGSKLIGDWANCMTLPYNHTHDLNHGVARSEFEITLSQEWDGWLTWNEKDVSHPLMTMILTSVTMVGWADVLDSDQGDFRRRRAVNLVIDILCQIWITSEDLWWNRPQAEAVVTLRRCTWMASGRQQKANFLE